MCVGKHVVKCKVHAKLLDSKCMSILWHLYCGAPVVCSEVCGMCVLCVCVCVCVCVRITIV